MDENKHIKDLFAVWKNARIKFITDHPATAKALALKIPVTETEKEHIASEDCWCNPETAYVDSETGVKVLVHWRMQ